VISIIKRDFDSLIKKYKAEINRQSNNGKTTLHWASINGYTTIVNILIKHKAQVDVKDDDDCTPLFFAAEAGHEKIVNMLIKHEADVIAALHNAISHGHVEVIKILLDYKQDTEVIKQALDHAADNNRLEAAKYLLTEEARTDKDVDFNEQFFYHIYYAAKKKYKNVVKLLLKKEKIDNIRLNYTAGKEDIEIINFLLKFGANHFSCFTDKHDRTPLHWAAFENDGKLVEDLTRKQNNLIYIEDEIGETALHEAVWNGHTKIVKILLNQGANINCKNKNGWKPLHIAVISFHIEVFELLKNKDEDDFQLNKFLENFDYHQLNNHSKFELYNSTLKFINIFNDLEQFEQKDNN
ncbi:6234_t:CDS:2, partial [Gigaspora margarita]